jgi:hypothetical protein
MNWTVEPSLLLDLLAAQTVTQKLQRIPTGVWINLLIWIGVIVIIVRVWKGLKEINDYAPYIVATFTGCVLFLTMVYYRNEPPFLTPVVEKLTHFFPTKSKQEQDLERMRRSLREQ